MPFTPAQLRMFRADAAGKGTKGPGAATAQKMLAEKAPVRTDVDKTGHAKKKGKAKIKVKADAESSYEDAIEGAEEPGDAKVKTRGKAVARTSLAAKSEAQHNVQHTPAKKGKGKVKTKPMTTPAGSY